MLYHYFCIPGCLFKPSASSQSTQGLLRRATTKCKGSWNLDLPPYSEVQAHVLPKSSPVSDSLFLPGPGPLELLCVVIVIIDREGNHKCGGIIVVLI